MQGYFPWVAFPVLQRRAYLLPEAVCAFCIVPRLQFPQVKYEPHEKVQPSVGQPSPLACFAGHLFILLLWKWVPSVAPTLLSYLFVKLHSFMHKIPGVFHAKSTISTAHYSSIHNSRSERSVYIFQSSQAIHYLIFSLYNLSSLSN